MRLFFALWPPAETARALAQWAREVQRDAGGRAAAEETIHLTLAFLGDAEMKKAAAVKVSGKAFELSLEKASYWRHNRIVWVGTEEMPAELKALAGRLQGALREEGFVLEERPFAAHVTLVRKANPPKLLPPLPEVRWPAREFLLVRSVSSRYEPVARFPLK